MTPYEKVCRKMVGAVPDNKRGRFEHFPSAKDLAKSLGIVRQTILSWPLVPGSKTIRIIPERAAKRIAAMTNNAVTEEEIKLFAQKYKAGGHQSLDSQ